MRDAATTEAKSSDFSCFIRMLWEARQGRARGSDRVLEGRVRSEVAHVAARTGCRDASCRNVQVSWCAHWVADAICHLAVLVTRNVAVPSVNSFGRVLDESCGRVRSNHEPAIAKDVGSVAGAFEGALVGVLSARQRSRASCLWNATGVELTNRGWVSWRSDDRADHIDRGVAIAAIRFFTVAPSCQRQLAWTCDFGRRGCIEQAVGGKGGDR